MKRQTQNQRLRNFRRAQKLHERALNSKHKKRIRRIQDYIDANYTEEGRKKLKYRKTPPKILALPSFMSLVHNYEETIAFLEQFRRQIFEDRCPTILDFTTLKAISPGAALVLVAEIDRWRRLFDFRPRAKDLDKWLPRIKALLGQMGFFEVLDVSNPPTDFRTLDTLQDGQEFLPFLSSDQVFGEKAIELRQQVEAATGESIVDSRGLYRSATEAMTNVIKHAYINKKRAYPTLQSRWWMSGSIRRDKNRVTVMIFDQGVGIAKTLPKKFGWELINGFLSSLGLSNGDGSMIRAAMEMGRSQTNLPHRGKGLPDIKKLIDSIGTGRLRIVSGNGCYEYSPEKGVIVSEVASSLGGTLIQWDFPIKQDEVCE